MPPVLEPLLVGKDREHPLETLIGELHQRAALLADQMFVVGLGSPGLEALEAFTELMCPDQSTLDQEIEGAVHGGEADPLTALSELAPDTFYREMIVRMKDDLSHQIPLADRLQIYADTATKARGIMKAENTDVLLSNHVTFDNAVAKMATLKEKPDQPNPFVVGEDTVDRFLTVLGECALATKAYVEAGQPGKEGEKK